MRWSKETWIAISGVTWFVVGVGLLTIGLRYVMVSAFLVASGKGCIGMLAPHVGGRQQAVLILIGIALTLGFIKGRFVLSKTVKRVVGRILSLQTPIRVSQVYSKGYLLLIGSMMLLGMSMKWLPVPLDLRGMLDVAVGSALMNGGLAYLKIAFNKSYL
ncbi:MAG: hypothetical protein JSS61_02875 [Verrucomicrobia bacterium]|nr:hypothetical protein [Verrucomicrobiota bacterium]